MEEKSSRFTKRLGIAATIVSLTGGSIALWDQVKPEEELPDLSGRWTITNTVTTSNSGKFDGEVYVYEVNIHQDADGSLDGAGEQTLYNGKVAPSHFPIRLENGKWKGNAVVVGFTIKGNREFIGSMKLDPDPDDPEHLSGSFSYTADGTKGTTDVRIK